MIEYSEFCKMIRGMNPKPGTSQASSVSSAPAAPAVGEAAAVKEHVNEPAIIKIEKPSVLDLGIDVDPLRTPKGTRHPLVWHRTILTIMFCS